MQCTDEDLLSKHLFRNRHDYYAFYFRVKINIKIELYRSLSELTLFGAVSIFMAVCMIEW